MKVQLENMRARSAGGMAAARGCSAGGGTMAATASPLRARVKWNGAVLARRPRQPPWRT
jgi:hypothetical protein